MLIRLTPLSDELDMEDDDVIDAMLFQVCSTLETTHGQISSQISHKCCLESRKYCCFEAAFVSELAKETIGLFFCCCHGGMPPSSISVGSADYFRFDILGVWYIFVNVRAENSPGSTR